MRQPHGNQSHRPARPRRPRRRTIVALIILVVALGAVAAAIVFSPSGGIRLGGGEAASDFLLQCEQRFSRADYAAAFELCSVALAKPARLRIHVEAARRMVLSKLALGDTGSAAAVMRTLEGELRDTTSGAIRGAVDHLARRYGAAVRAYQACGSRNPLLQELEREARAARRLRLTDDLIRDIARIRCA